MFDHIPHIYIWFHPFMDPNVLIKAVRLGECFITYFAWKKVSSQYGILMCVFRAARLGECLITFPTNIRFHPSMDPNVCL